MDIVFPKPGRYVVAVSGGVDSVTLLDILQRQPDLELIVAHFDHGIRQDSYKDMELTKKLAADYGLQLFSEKASLGKDASEAVAREARYKFLRQIRKDNSALAIITAHHQDDLLETAILNMLRGTGRKGLTSLNSNSEILRPLLKIPKQNLIKYAEQHQLVWNEDSTNQDVSYLRNYVRHNILPKFNETDKARLLNKLTSLQVANSEIDDSLNEILITQLSPQGINRQWFNNLPHSLSKELMASWLRKEGLRDFDSNTLERLVVGSKTAAAGKQIEAVKNYKIVVSKDTLALRGPER